MTPQLQNALLKARNDLRETAPLIHCITNPIAINDCANGILAVGGKPIMAEHPDEVEEITCIAGALGVNIGNITDARRTSVLTSAKAAKTAGVPISFDAVGVTCSALRRDLTHTLLREACPEILKGNDAEIRAIAGAHFESRGIDVLRTNTAETIEIAKMLASTLHCVVLVTGKTDIITNGETTELCENGTPRLSLVTGTGTRVVRFIQRRDGSVYGCGFSRFHHGHLRRAGRTEIRGARVVPHCAFGRTFAAFGR